MHIDFGTNENRDLLILVDVYSKWIEVESVMSTSAQKTIDVLRSWFARFGVPHQLVSDNGPQFTSELFKDFLKRNGVYHIRHHLTAPRQMGQLKNLFKL